MTKEEFYNYKFTVNTTFRVKQYFEKHKIQAVDFEAEKIVAENIYYDIENLVVFEEEVK